MLDRDLDEWMALTPKSKRYGDEDDLSTIRRIGELIHQFKYHPANPFSLEIF